MNLRDVRPIALVMLSVSSIQLGIAISTTAFPIVGPLGATFTRSLFGAGLLLAVMRPNLRAFTWSDVKRVAPCSLGLAGVNVFGYLAIDRLPLGVVSTIEMVAPLTIAAWGRRGSVDLFLLALAGVGVATLTLSEGFSGSIDPAGLAFAGISALSFAVYIVAGRRVTKMGEGIDGVVLALVLSASIQAVPGLTFGHLVAMTPAALVSLTAAGIMATLVPFVAEMVALRTLSMATFGLLLSLEPVAALLSGALIRREFLEPVQLVGIAVVITSSVGVLGPRTWLRRFADRELAADETVRALTNVPLFSCMSLGELASVARLGEERHVPAGMILASQGAAGDEFFVVAEGAIGIRLDGREINHLGPGDFFGEIALLTGGIRSATAVAAEPTRLFVLGKPAFDGMLKRQPRIEDKVLTAVSSRMRYR